MVKLRTMGKEKSPGSSYSMLGLALVVLCCVGKPGSVHLGAQAFASFKTVPLRLTRLSTTRGTWSVAKTQRKSMDAHSACGTEAPGRRSVARRLRPRARSRNAEETAATESRNQQSSQKEKGGVGNIVRLEMALRLKEMKLVTSQATGATGHEGNELGEMLARGEVPGSSSYLERQISLMTERINSIAAHLKVTPSDAVSQKGIVVLVKRRRILLESLRERDNEGWLATTEKLGLRQRPEPGSWGNEWQVTTRRARWRARGKLRKVRIEAKKKEEEAARRREVDAEEEPVKDVGDEPR